MELKTPHLDFIEKHKIDIQGSDAPPTLKRAITNWNNGLKQYEKATDETLKNQWKEKLETRSQKISEDLAKFFKEDPPASKEPEKKDPEKKDPEKKEPKAKDPEKKDPEKKDPEKKDPENKDPDKKDPSKNPHGLSDQGLKEKAIIDQLFAQKAKNGKLELTEDELNEAGFNCWGRLGFFSGEFAGYIFSSSLGSETWTITKEKKKEKKKEEAA